MVGHYHIGMNYKTIIFLTMLPAFYEYVFVLIFCKHVYPTYYSEGDKVAAIGIVELIFIAHSKT